jgi:hypothetical protein
MESETEAFFFFEFRKRKRKEAKRKELKGLFPYDRLIIFHFNTMFIGLKGNFQYFIIFNS